MKRSDSLVSVRGLASVLSSKRQSAHDHLKNVIVVDEFIEVESERQAIGYSRPLF